MKACSSCFEEKSDSDFYRDPRTKRGLYTECKSCHSARCNRRNRDPRIRDRWSEPLVRELRDEQEGRCAICREPLRLGHGDGNLDHDHSAGKVRGILCRNCNLAIGLLKDSPATCRLAAEYLERGGCKEALGIEDRLDQLQRA